MKILIVSQYYYPENFVTNEIAEMFAFRGHDVSVLTAKPNYGFGYILPKYKDINCETVNGVKIYRINIVPRHKSKLSIVRNYLSFWRNSKKWIRECHENFDVIYTLSLSPVTVFAAGNLYKQLHNVPHIGHVLDIWPESVLATRYTKKISILYLILYYWSKKLYSHLDTILVGSPTYEDYFKKVLKLNNDISYVDQPALLAKRPIPYQYTTDKFNIVYCGNISKLQLVHLIVPAMVKANNDNVVFHIVGNGNYSSELVKQINDNNLKDKVVFHGSKPLNESMGYIVSGDAVFVSLSSEGYVGKTIPNKLTVAMACSKPIIAMISGDGREILNRSKGAVFAEETPTSLARAINEMYNLKKEERSLLGKNNYKYYNDNLKLEKIVIDIENALFSKQK